MHGSDESTAPPEEPTAPPAAVLPPTIDPAKWEDFPTFRETFLRWFTEPTANAALRGFGALLHDLILEANRVQPEEPEGIYRHDLRAALADLRAIQGFLAFIGKSQEDLDEDEAEDADSLRFCYLAEQLAPRVGRIADSIEGALA